MAVNPLRDDSAPRTAPPEAWRPMLKLARLATRPIDRFFRIEAASGILLLVAAGAALAWANSPWAHAYQELWHTTLGFHFGRL
ncbi:MAG TPA: Na+/H+ antiporter NhaA, partial [Polyangiaceae bacterium]